MRFGPLYQDVVLAPLAEQLLSGVQLGAGPASVLDVLADAGTLTRALLSATAFGPEPRISAVDIDPVDTELQEMAVRRSLTVRTCTQDDLPFADHTFDVTFNLITLGWADAEQMVAEMRRVTKPGGMICILGFGASGGTHERVLTDAYASATGRLAPYMKYLAWPMPPPLRRRQTLREVLRFRGPDHFLDVMMQGRNMLASITSGELDLLRAAVSEQLQVYAAADGTMCIPIDVELSTQTV